MGHWDLSTWNVTLLAVHMIGTFGCALLAVRTPDRLQGVILGVLMASFWVLIVAYSLAITGDPDHEYWRWIGYHIEHAGALLYVFRLCYLTRITCRTSR